MCLRHILAGIVHIWISWVFAGAAGASMLVLATGFGLARGLNLSQSVILLVQRGRKAPVFSKLN